MKAKVLALLLCASIVGTMNPSIVLADEDAVYEELLDEAVDSETELVICGEQELTGEAVLISSSEDLLAMRDSLDSNKGGDYKLGADIDMSGKDWVMPRFSPDSFDGDGHKISNINIKLNRDLGDDQYKIGTSDMYGYGMFCDSYVKNLTLENVNLSLDFTAYPYSSSTSTYSSVGAMIGAGSAYNCKIIGKNKFSATNKTVNDRIVVGGIVGALTGDATNCALDGELDFSSLDSYSCGGIVGGIDFDSNYHGDTISQNTISKCNTSNTSMIKGSYSAGGICGAYIHSSSLVTRNVVSLIKDCSNAAKIEATEVAGIAYAAGDPNDPGNYSLVIENCTNEADLYLASSGVSNTVCGIAHSPTVLKNCVNNGNITIEDGPGEGGWSGKCAAGLAYSNCIGGSIENCVNRGDIKAGYKAAGLLLDAYGLSMSKSYNTGDVISKTSAGLIDSAYHNRKYNAVINQCFNSGNIRGEYRASGLLGYVCPAYQYTDKDAYSFEMSDCFNCGIVYGKESEYSHVATCGVICQISYSGGGNGLSDNDSVVINRVYNVGVVDRGYAEYDYKKNGNQIVSNISSPTIKGEAKNSKFVENDCYYLKDSMARPMPMQDLYAFLDDCKIDEKEVAADSLKNIYSEQSDVWGHGKNGYEFPYLIGVGEQDLPKDFSHSKQLEEYKKLKDAKDEPTIDPNAGDGSDKTELVYDKSGKAVNITAKVVDEDGNKVGVSLDNFLNLSKRKVDKIPLKSAKEMKIFGYKFKGWFLNGKKVTKIDVSKLDENVTLEARYTINRIKISYKFVKPAKGVKVNGKIAPTKYKYTESIVLGGNEISAEGYKLVGYTKDKKNLAVAEYKVGDTVAIANLLTKGSGVTLYSVWEKVNY